MSGIEWVNRAIEQTGLDVPPKQLVRLVREYKSLAKECGHGFARRQVSSTILEWERTAVARLFACGQLR